MDDQGTARTAPMPWQRSALGALLVVVGVAVLWTLIDAAAGALGPQVRRSAMVHVETGPEGSMVTYDDAAEAVAMFLSARDTVSLDVPWTMTVDQLLRLYHLENNRSARSALAEQVGAGRLDAILPEGTRVRFALTPSEAGR